MAEWFGDKDCGVPAAKKGKVMSDVTSRFGNKVTSDSELKEISRGLCRKTQSRIKFGACAISSPGVIGEKSKMTRCLGYNNGEILNRWPSLYMKETRGVDGKQFPSRTIDMLLSGLKRYRLEKIQLPLTF